ncbi:MAG: hypothetical protein ACC619_11070, partial [Paracoccaceae bacterium]
AQELTPAQVHMGHVTEGWFDTPDGIGLLPTAIAEAEIAITHANLAAQQPDNLDWMKAHSLHVLQAVDASAVMEGPALGFGVGMGGGGVAKHIGLAAEAEGATENIKAHAVHVASAAKNTSARVAEIIANVAAIQAATSAAEAAPIVAQMQQHADQLLNGADANGDGDIGWQEGEGGLLVAAAHMQFMRDGENL